MAKILLEQGYPVFQFEGVVGILNAPAEVTFVTVGGAEVEKEIAAEHLVANNKQNLVSLLNHGKTAFNAETGEVVVVVEPVTKTELESKKIPELKKLAADLKLDIADDAKKPEIIEALFEKVGIENPPAEVVVEEGK